MMARYNAWQNAQLAESLDGVSQEVLNEDRGAFFGSIHGTLNHILWGDRAWMHRLNPDFPAPDADVQHTQCTPTIAVWRDERLDMDHQISAWADALPAAFLSGIVTWRSYLLQKDFNHAADMCVMHLFNHQTHHRGQVHAMMTAAGLQAPVSDIPFMPGEE